MIENEYALVIKRNIERAVAQFTPEELAEYRPPQADWSDVDA